LKQRVTVIRSWRALGRRAVVLLALALVATGCGADEKTGTKNPAAYVAIGDSYTSGPGLDPVADIPCKRSAVNYPTLVAKALKITDFADRSCGGANTLNLQQPQMYGYARLNDPQLDAVNKDTTLVTVGLGLNNQAISVGLLLVCLTPDGEPLSDKCQRYLGQPESTIDDQMKVAAGQVETALETIRAKAPQARIVLVGYPRVVPDKGDCPDRLPVPEAQVERMRAALPVANRLWAQAARKAGATYIDVYAASQGHDICADDPWIAGYSGIPGRGPQMHPYASYHKAVAKLIVAALAH
jgi:hypothetical protein